MKFSGCQVFAVVLILGLLFMSAIAPILPFALAHTEYETITTKKEIMKTVTSTEVSDVYKEQEEWSHSEGKYIKAKVKVGTKTVVVTKPEGTGEYTTETVPMEKAHNHWYSKDRIIGTAITLTGIVVAIFLVENID